MRLKLLTPTETVMDEVEVKINAEGPNGLFCLLPRHRDWVATLVPGILGLTTPDGGEAFVAVDQGVLVIEMGDGQLDRMEVGLFLGIVIAHGATAIDAPGSGNGSGGREQGFDEGGFAGTAMADEGQGPNLGEGKVGHGGVRSERVKE